MRAAVLTAPDARPVYQEHPAPQAPGGPAVVVDVLAAGLHHLTRATATGAHYSGSARFPRVPGADGVVRDPSGRLRYVALDGRGDGTFAEQTVVDLRRSVVLPDDADPVRVAAAMNPGMSSWLALRRRIRFEPGQDVLVLGATGSSGRMAVQVARLCGAGRVVAAGRDPERLAPLRDLGADETVLLDELDELDRAADVDVVLDYLWGPPAADGVLAMLHARTDRGRPLTWVQIGSMAGDVASFPSIALRSAPLQVVGSGIGSVSPQEIVAELPALVDVVLGGAVDVRARAVPLDDVAAVWDERSGDRVVVVP